MTQELAFPGTDDGRTVEEFDAQIKAENAALAGVKDSLTTEVQPDDSEGSTS